MVDFTGGTWRSLIDGSEVSGIPDNAIWRLPLDEGDGTTASDDQGDTDGTLDNPDWISNSKYFGDFALDFDQSNNDEVTMDFLPINGGDDITFCVTVDLDGAGVPSDRQVIWNHIRSDNDDVFAVGYRDGDLAATVYDSDNESSRVETHPDTSTEFRLQVSFSGLDVPEIRINATQNFESEGFAPNEGDGHWLGSNADNESYDSIIDAPVVYDKVLTDDDFQKDVDQHL